MRVSRTIFIFGCILTLAALACNANTSQLQEQAASAATQAAAAATKASEVATQAAPAIGTASALANEAGQAAGTAVAQATPPSSLPTALPTNIDLNALQQTFAAALPDQNGNIIITITDAQLNEAMRLRQAQAAAESGTTPLIQNPEVTFTDGLVIFTGQVSQPVTAQLTITFRPFVTDGVLQFEVISASLGSINVPPALLGTAESTINATLNEAMSYATMAIALESVIVSDNTMTITGKVNQ
ncbi:MAG: hypothetical protein D6706_11405 [Chloroflexi bacterium]|nr:MAG: hypothetical protein D6706_11405 [Chloroflexota bacterium]